MFPSECLLERRVRMDHHEDLAATNLPLFILKCKDRKAEGYADSDTLEIYNKWLEEMVIGVRLADAPPAASYLVILHSASHADIVAADETVIVISMEFPGEAGPSYLIYDAVASSLRMIPAPRDHSWVFTLSSSVYVARPCRGHDYALVHMGRLVDGGEEALFLWWPSSSSPPWSKYKKASLPDTFDWSGDTTTTELSLNGHAYWMDLLCGVLYCSCDALFDDDSSVVKFGGFIPLPAEERGHHLSTKTKVFEPDAYRTMGVVCDDFIRFVSINGFQEFVELKDRTVTVWNLLGHDEGWRKVHEFSLEMLWGFEGFGDLPKDLTPMYPVLSTKDTDVIYLGLGENCEFRFRFESQFFPTVPCYLLAVDMRNKIVRNCAAIPPEDQDNWFNSLVTCGISVELCMNLVMMKESPCRRSAPSPEEEEA